MNPENILIPGTLSEMLEKVFRPMQKASNPAWIDYNEGWITAAAKRHYRDLTIRERLKGTEGTQVVRLICELAISHAILEWYRVKDTPPPAPDIRNVDSLL